MPAKLTERSFDEILKDKMFEQPEEKGRIVLRMPSNLHGPGGYYIYPANKIARRYMDYADKAWYVEQGDWVIVKDRYEGFSECPDLSLDDVDKAEILLQAQEV